MLGHEHDVIRRILGCRTLSEFFSLPPKECIELLEQHLVQPNRPVIIDVAATWHDLSRTIAYGSATATTGPGLALEPEEERLLTMARDMYYSQNQFVVHLHSLSEFLHDPVVPSDAGEPIISLVRDITVIVPVGHELEASEDRTVLLERLRSLTEVGGLCNVTVELTGTGTLNGSDWPTQETIRSISAIIRRVLLRSGERASVVRCLPNGKSREIRSYWQPPCEATMRKGSDGGPSFQEHMQVQIRAWADAPTAIRVEKT